MNTEETKYKCQINIYIWCKSQASVDALKIMFSGTSDFKLRYIRIHQGNENTVVTFPIFHDLSMPEQGLFSCSVEGFISEFPGLRDVTACAYEFTSLCNDLMGMEIEYMEVESKSFGVFKVTRENILQRWVRPMDWPDIDCRKNCPYEDDDDTGKCTNCHDVLSDILEKKGTETTYSDTVCYGFVPEEKQEETKMNMDNLDRPNLNKTTDKEKAQIFDALSNISCIDTDLIVKLNLSDAVLRKVVRLADCLMAIFFGDPGDELSQIDDLSDNLKQLNQATSNLNETLDSIRSDE